MSAQKKRNFKIEAFKHRVEVDPKYADKTWRVLEHAIHEIYNHNASGLSFEELYRFDLQRLHDFLKISKEICVFFFMVNLFFLFVEFNGFFYSELYP